jgi:glutamate formiminotransferase
VVGPGKSSSDRHVLLLAVPNVSEGRDPDKLSRLEKAFDGRLLDLHSDPDHNRSVLTLAGSPGELVASVLAGARAAKELLDLREHRGIHPRVGVLDVAPIVYLEPEDRGAACAEALVLADRLGNEAGLPVFLYGELAGGRTRAELRRGGPAALADRTARGEVKPDFGPAHLEPRSGAVLVAARPPLVAFNIDLHTEETLERARAIAALIREGGPEGLPGVRALGLWLNASKTAQISTNIEDHRKTAPHQVVDAVARHARIRAIELVGLAPKQALEGLPRAIEARNIRSIEDALATIGAAP